MQWPAGIEVLRGDRESEHDLRVLAGHGPWDAVIDPAGSVPAVVSQAARILADAASHCTFVSTVSAYRGWPHSQVNEESPLWDGDPDCDPGTRQWDPDAYGPLKVGCEKAWQQTYPSDRLLILRPHVVLGPAEYVGRLPWWLRRVNRGGPVLAPAPDRGIQPVDVRDLSAYLLNQVESQSAGIYNVAPPNTSATYGDMLRFCLDAVGTPQVPLDFVWADENWLETQGVAQWTELPLWRNATAPWSMDTSRAYETGLRCRPLADTVKDTWHWLQDGGQPIHHERFDEHGIEPSKESEIIERWRSRSSRHRSDSTEVRREGSSRMHD